MGCGNSDPSVLIPDSYRWTRSAQYKGTYGDVWLDVKALLCPACHSKAMTIRNTRLLIAFACIVIGGAVAAVGVEAMALSAVGLLILGVGIFVLVFTLVWHLHPSSFYSNYRFSEGHLYLKFASSAYQEAFDSMNPGGIKFED